MKTKRVIKAQVQPVVRPKNRKIEVAIKLLKKNGYTIKMPEELQETEYKKALHTEVKPIIWPPIVMTEDDLQHFRKSHGLA